MKIEKRPLDSFQTSRLMKMTVSINSLTSTASRTKMSVSANSSHASRTCLNVSGASYTVVMHTVRVTQ